MQVTILGTSSAKPTIKRNHAGIWVDLNETRFLLDCGEGTQRQITIAKKKATKIDYILLTHWHADHAAGISPILQSMRLNERTKPLTIIGPNGTKEKIGLLKKVFPYSETYALKIIETNNSKPEKVLETKNVDIWSVNAEHHGIPCVAYSIKQKDTVKINTEYTAKYGLVKNKILGELQKGKDITYNGKKIQFKKATFAKTGKKITYITDTITTPKLIALAKNSDLLICESTYAHAEKKLADERGHMTAKQAGQLAKKSKTKKLVTTHFSTKYKNKKELLQESKKEFENTTLGQDFLEILV
ncbi:MAG: ribonuclease Z [Nanoarchaeota archaeon]|nr:ribonuclease Z [Nanoarchaeota archaeon]